MSEFPFVHREPVRFNDCDPMGHLNNATYSTYLEQARIGALGGLEEFILARVEIDFRSGLRFGEAIEVRSRGSESPIRFEEGPTQAWFSLLLCPAQSRSGSSLAAFGSR
jgi:acyl-ACP thioesterase